MEGKKKRLTDTERNYWKHFSHPGLPKVLDILEEGDSLCYVMEYSPGKTLQEIFEAEGRQSAAQLRNWMLQICDILDYLHGRSPAVIHGDLKPSNLYCLNDGRIMLLDFGASFLDGSSSGFCFGTAAFASPEQLEGRSPLDCRSDLYSLGASMYFLHTGKYWNKGERVFPCSDFLRILETCMKEDPAKRYSSCGELKRVLVRQGKSPGRVCGFILLAALLCIFAGQKWETGAADGGQMVSSEEILSPQQTEEEYQKDKSESEANSYEEGLLSGRISEIKSAILLSPGREEGYQKLLELFLQDGVFDREEELELRLLLNETEETFRKNPKGYYAFLYQTGNAAWFYSEGGEGSFQGASWFKEALEAPEGIGLSESERRQANVYVKIESFRENYQKKRSGEGEPDFADLWDELCLAAEQEAALEKVEDRTLSLQLFSEILTQAYLYAEEFRRAGIEAEKFAQLTEEVGKAALLREAEGNTEREKELLSAIQEKEVLLSETLQSVFKKGEDVE